MRPDLKLCPNQIQLNSPPPSSLVRTRDSKLMGHSFKHWMAPQHLKHSTLVVLSWAVTPATLPMAVHDGTTSVYTSLADHVTSWSCVGETIATAYIHRGLLQTLSGVVALPLLAVNTDYFSLACCTNLSPCRSNVWAVPNLASPRCIHGHLIPSSSETAHGDGSRTALLLMHSSYCPYECDWSRSLEDEACATCNGRG